MVYCLSVLRSVWGMSVVAVTLVVFEMKYNMVRRFAIRHLCSRFLDKKMAVWLNGETEDLFSFWVVLGCVRGFWQQEECIEKRVWVSNV